ncbi:MAG: DUF5698 domain-containing protein [Clostridiales bacterium]|nr:DUF5698 domain-containing protein [Clostridiales bacterium]
MQTLRMMMVVRGEKLKGAIIGFFEVILYVVVLNAIFSSLDNIGNLIAYALGYATGCYVGLSIEERLAIGIQYVQVITMKEPLRLAEILRDNGHGVTVLEGAGRSGPHFILQVLLERKQVERFSETVSAWDEDVFMIVSDAKKFRGGVMRHSKTTGAAFAEKWK